MPGIPRPPWKKLRELEARFEELIKPRLLAVTFQLVSKNFKVLKEISLGGMWDPIKCKYTSYEKGGKIFQLSRPQWEYLMFHYEAMLNFRAERDYHRPPVQVAILHGGRRAGKTKALEAVVNLWTIGRPASKVMIIGLRKKHGLKIITGMKRRLPFKTWNFDRKFSTLTLINGSRVFTTAQVNHNEDRGDDLDAVIFDEAAHGKEEAFDSLIPSINDRNGVTGLASTPKALNWFHRKVEMATDPDPDVSSAVRVIQLKAKDNIFKPAAASRAAKMKFVMGEAAALQEGDGEFILKEGKVFAQFDKKAQRKPWEKMPTDVTGDLIRTMYPANFKNKQPEWIIGVDYNASPTAGIAIKFSDDGHPWLCHEIISNEGTAAWGIKLESWLYSMGHEKPHDSAVIIADASGAYQDPIHKKRKPSNMVLRKQGWTVKLPQTGSKRNPDRGDKMVIVQALVKNANGDHRLFIDGDCRNCMLMLDEIPLTTDGQPDRGNQHIHWYDAVSYAIYRVWGTAFGQKFFKIPLVQSRRERSKNT